MPLQLLKIRKGKEAATAKLTALNYVDAGKEDPQDLDYEKTANVKLIKVTIPKDGFVGVSESSRFRMKRTQQRMVSDA